MGNKLRKWAVLGMAGLIMATAVPVYAIPQVVQAESKANELVFIQSTDLVHIGMTYYYEAQEGDQYGGIKWSVSDKTIATIGSKTGKLIGKKAGQVTVTATADSGKSISIDVTVSGNDITMKKNSYHKKFKNSKGKLVMEYTYEYPTLSGDFDGISKINKSIIAIRNQWIKDEQQYVSEAKRASTTDYFIPFGDEVTYQITYNTGKLISIQQTGYIYQGGAHGMPYRTQTIYNLDTGKQLSLKSIMKGTDSQIKKVITKAFQAVIDKDPELYWPEAIDTVKKTKLSQMQYYLTPKGMCFFYSPYDLAAYAAGYIEATVPFTEKDNYKDIVLN